MAKPKQEPKGNINVTGCCITNNSAANEHTRAAVEALANAAKANADAIAEAARALKGGDIRMDAGFRFEQ